MCGKMTTTATNFIWSDLRRHWQIAVMNHTSHPGLLLTIINSAFFLAPQVFFPGLWKQLVISPSSSHLLVADFHSLLMHQNVSVILCIDKRTFCTLLCRTSKVGLSSKTDTPEVCWHQMKTLLWKQNCCQIKNYYLTATFRILLNLHAQMSVWCFL